MKWRTDAWLLINSNVFSLSSFSCVLLTFYSVIKQKKRLQNPGVDSSGTLPCCFSEPLPFFSMISLSVGAALCPGAPAWCLASVMLLSELLGVSLPDRLAATRALPIC